MGMSASQARYLSLTGRKSDLEYEIQQIGVARMTLADEGEDIAKTYSNQMSNRRLFFQSDGADFQKSMNLPRLTYDVLTKSIADGGLSMRITDANNKIVVAFLPPGADPEKYTVDLNVLLPDVLETKLRDAQWILQKQNFNAENGDGDWVNTSWQGNANIVDDLNKEDDTAAQATYDVRSGHIAKKDKELEMRLTQLATEQKSLDQEMDAVKKVIDKNVEGTFKTFA